MTDDDSDMLRFLPVGLDVRGRPCLIVGGGAVATRKVRTLLRAQAAVTIVSPAVAVELAALIEAGRVRWIEDSYEARCLDDAFLVIAATDDEGLNRSIVEDAANVGALVCDASSAQRSQLIFAALLQSGEATIAVFTDGRDPAGARDTRDRIARLLAEDDRSAQSE